MKTVHKSHPPHMGEKQVAVLKALIFRNPDGTLLDVHQLMKKIPGASRAAMISTLRHLMSHHLVSEDGKQLRDGRMKTVYAATTVGYALMAGRM